MSNQGETQEVTQSPNAGCGAILRGLRVAARDELIENLNSLIWHLDRQKQTIFLNHNGERKKGAAGSFTLSEAYERPDVGIRDEAEFKSIR
jgi:hypothetical protein